MDVRRVRSLAIAGLGAFLASCGGSTAPQTHPAIGLAVASIEFGAQFAGGNPSAQTVNITNSGTGTLSGLSLGMISYAAGASGWLNATLSTGTAPASISLNATTGSLAQGSYSATIPVTAAGATAPASLKVTFVIFPPAGNTTLAVGQDTTFLTTPVIATNIVLQPGEQYLIAVVNTDTASAANEDFTLFGSMTSTQRVRLPSQSRIPSLARRSPVATHGGLQLNAATVKRMQALRTLQRNHLAMLDHNTSVFQGVARTGRVAPSSGGAVARPRFTISQTVGTVNKIYIANAFGATCTQVDSIGARTVAVGQHVIVLADTNTAKWPSNMRDSAFYQAFANEYDAVTFPHINNNIGNPLAYDSHLSGIGKITVVISPVLNHFGGGIVAFVDGCDFFPLNDPNFPDLDNFTEMFYYWAPDTTSGWTGRAWEDLMRGTAAHESKHIVSYTDRIINNGLQFFEERWLEEGLAQESAEIWERHFNNTTWKGGATFAQVVACEIYINGFTPACQDSTGTLPVALTGSHLPFYFDYLAAESQSPTGLGFGNSGNNATPTNYGAGWAFARWATDQYATTEPSFIMSLVNQNTLAGLANVSAVTGKSVPELLVYWNLASAVYDTATYTAVDPRITNPTLNFGQIFWDGQTDGGRGGFKCGKAGTPCGIFGPNFATTPVWPIQPAAVSTGNLNAKVTGVSGTTAAYFLLTSTGSGRQYIQLQSGTGASISTSSGLRIGIIRVK